MIRVQRGGALGDVVLTTPIIRRLRREYPDAFIQIETAYSEVFKNNPHLNVDPDKETIRNINLNLAYERCPNMHIVETYMREAFGDAGDPAERQQELFFPQRRLFKEGKHRLVAVHAAVAGWKNRTLPRETWRAVVDGLYARGYRPILVGTPYDDIADCEVIRLHAADLLGQAQLIASCEAFIGSDSGLLHVAGATDTPIVGVFTCARPETRLPWRHGELGWRCAAVVPDLDCVGCLARRAPPVTTEHCERGDRACVSTGDLAGPILAAFEKLMASGEIIS